MIFGFLCEKCDFRPICGLFLNINYCVYCVFVRACECVLMCFFNAENTREYYLRFKLHHFLFSLNFITFHFSSSHGFVYGKFRVLRVGNSHGIVLAEFRDEITSRTVNGEF